MKPLEKIKLTSKATALIEQISTVSVIKRIPLLAELTNIINRLGGDIEGQIDDAGAYDAETNITPEQADSGDYKKGKVNVIGLDILIENPKGSTRSGTDEDGNNWQTTMENHYGDIAGTKGADGDPLDVFLGDIAEPQQVFVIDQINADTRRFDEHKIMIGCDSSQSAKKAYFSNYSKGWQGFGAVTAMTVDKFKQWVAGGKTRQPLKYQKGDFQEAEAVTSDVEVLPSDYQHLTAVEVKSAMLSLSENGVPLSKIAPVFDYWLTVNQAA